MWLGMWSTGFGSYIRNGTPLYVSKTCQVLNVSKNVNNYPEELQSLKFSISLFDSLTRYELKLSKVYKGKSVCGGISLCVKLKQQRQVNWTYFYCIE